APSSGHSGWAAAWNAVPSTRPMLKQGNARPAMVRYTAASRWTSGTALNSAAQPVGHTSANSPIAPMMPATSAAAVHALRSARASEAAGADVGGDHGEHAGAEAEAHRVDHVLEPHGDAETGQRVNAEQPDEAGEHRQRHVDEDRLERHRQPDAQDVDEQPALETNAAERQGHGGAPAHQPPPTGPPHGERGHPPPGGSSRPPPHRAAAPGPSRTPGSAPARCAGTRRRCRRSQAPRAVPYRAPRWSACRAPNRRARRQRS